MFILKPSNIVFGVLIVLMLVPKTKSFIQENIHKVIGKINPPSVIAVSEQETIGEYQGQLRGLNNSNVIDFEDLKDKVVFVNFWATWCPPCVAEMGSLQELYTKYGNDVVFLFVTNDTADVTNEFLKDHNYTMPCYTKTSDLPDILSHRSIPNTFIINKEGNIVLHKVGGADWNSKKIQLIIKDLIKE